MLGRKGPQGQLGAVEPLYPAFQLGHALALPAFLRGEDLHGFHGLQGLKQRILIPFEADERQPFHGYDHAFTLSRI